MFRSAQLCRNTIGFLPCLLAYRGKKTDCIAHRRARLGIIGQPLEFGVEMVFLARVERYESWRIGFGCGRPICDN